MAKPLKKSTPYAAVSVEVQSGWSCEAARSILGERHLVQEAPILPLRDCSNPRGCRCRYRHWDDRRQEDRRAIYRGIGEQYVATDKRSGRDRRSR